MTRRRAAIAAVGLALALVAAIAVFDVITFAALHDTQNRLGAVQHTFAVSQKASTRTRVSTVSQRCALTGQLVAAFGDRPSVAAGFAQSLRECRRQLTAVTAINAATPSPR